LRIAASAIDWGENVEICDLLARVVLKVAMVHIPYLPLMNALNSKPEIRTAIARAAIKACPEDWIAHSLVSYGVVQECDLSLCLDDFESAEPTEFKEKPAFFIAAILARASSFDTEIFDRVFETAQRNAILAEALQPVLGVTLGSDRAEFLRASFGKATGDQDSQEIAQMPEVGSLLTAFEQGRIFAFIEICDRLGSAYGDPSDGGVFPGWSLLDEGTQTRLVRAARKYLKESRPQKEDWIETGPW
jgi:hypothetical protein